MHDSKDLTTTLTLPQAQTDRKTDIGRHTQITDAGRQTDRQTDKEKDTRTHTYLPSSNQALNLLNVHCSIIFLLHIIDVFSHLCHLTQCFLEEESERVRREKEREKKGRQGKKVREKMGGEGR